MAEETTVETEQTEDFNPTPLTELFGGASTQTSTPEPETKEVEEQTEEKTEELETSPWEADDNPYKQKASDLETKATTLEKRFKDTQGDWTRMRQKMIELGIEDVPEQSEEDRIKELAFNERERASLSIAKNLYGEDHVNKLLYADDAPWKTLGNNPAYITRVQVSDAPVMEALNIIEEHKFFGKYGTDVTKIPDKIRAEIEANLREKITKDIQKKLSKKEQLPKTLSGVNSTDIKDEDKGFQATPLKALFG